MFFAKQCFAVFRLREDPKLMRRCFQFPRTRYGAFFSFTLFLSFFSQNDEKKPLLTSHTTAFSYQTILSIPYAHVIRDDKLSIDSSNVVEKNVTDTFLLFNTALPDQAYETGMTHITRIHQYVAVC
jgi:hypothetical protein